VGKSHGIVVLLQRLAEATGSVLSSVLNGLTSYYQRDSAAAAPFLPGTEVEGLPTEAWLHLGQGKVPQDVLEGLKPQWHVPTKEEVCAAASTTAPRHSPALCPGCLKWRKVLNLSA